MYHILHVYNLVHKSIPWVLVQERKKSGCYMYLVGIKVFPLYLFIFIISIFLILFGLLSAVAWKENQSIWASISLHNRKGKLQFDTWCCVFAVLYLQQLTVIVLSCMLLHISLSYDLLLICRATSCFLKKLGLIIISGHLTLVYQLSILALGTG